MTSSCTVPQGAGRQHRQAHQGGAGQPAEESAGGGRLGLLRVRDGDSGGERGHVRDQVPRALLRPGAASLHVC